MTNVRAFDKNKDTHIIQQWFEMRSLPFNAMLLSPTGFIASINGEDVAALFVYFFLGVPMAQIDNLISNPKAGYRVYRALKCLMRTAETFVKKSAELGKIDIHAIQCNIKQEMVDTFKIKNRDNWIVTNSNTVPCYYIINK